MKRILASLVLTGIAYDGMSQQVEKKTVEIDKQLQAAQSIQFPEQEASVEDAIESIIKKNDGKVRKQRGYIVGRRMKLNELSGDKMDYYFKVDAEGRKKSQTSTVTLAIKQADGRFVSDSSNTDLQQKVSFYLSGFPQRVQLYKKDVEIAELQANLSKLTKAMAQDRKNNQKDLDKKMKQVKEIEQRLSDLNSSH